jgi:hypothetical protein
MNESVYSMEVMGTVQGRPYRHTFWFVNQRARRSAYEKVRWLNGKGKANLHISLDSHKEFSPATVKRMVEEGLHSPYEKGKT